MTKLNANEKMVRKSLYCDGKMVAKPEMTKVILAAGKFDCLTVKRGRLYRDGKNVSKAETIEMYLAAREEAVKPVKEANKPVNEDSLEDVLGAMKPAA